MERGWDEAQPIELDGTIGRTLDDEKCGAEDEGQVPTLDDQKCGAEVGGPTVADPQRSDA